MYKIRNAKLEARNIRHKAWTDPLSFVAEISIHQKPKKVNSVY